MRELIGHFLKAGVMEDHRVTILEAGTPQGGVISHLLANISLNALDHQMATSGRKMVRYADDFVILCHSVDEANGALAEVQAWTAHAGLTLHPTKTRIVDLGQPNAWFDFLGYRFKRHDKDGVFRILRLIRDKSLARARDAIRAATPRNSPPLERLTDGHHPSRESLGARLVRLFPQHPCQHPQQTGSDAAQTPAQHPLPPPWTRTMGRRRRPPHLAQCLLRSP